MKTALKILLTLVVLISLSLLVLARGKQPEPFPADSESAARLAFGPLAVAQHDELFVDASRSTEANGKFPGAAERRLQGTVWYPAGGTGEAGPLLVYSHGYSSSRREAVYLARHLASLGYVVVAVDYPLTHMRAPGGPMVRDVVNQPADVRFLIDTLLAQGRAPGHPLEGRIDESRIGAFGLSLGGLTTTLAAFHPDLRDPRIRAALSIAGPTFVFREVFFRHHPLPFLMLAGDIDALVPYPSNAAPVPQQVPGGELVTIEGGSHTGFAGPAAGMRWLANPDAVGCWIVQRNIGNDMEEPWFDLLGTPELGIDYDAEPALCTMDPLPRAMNPLRQQMITTVVVSSFFEREFARSPARRDAADRYLQQVMARELPGVRYAGPVAELPRSD